MKNPFRTEAAAFHFLWGTIGYFGLIAIASLINTWAGLVVFVLETGILVGWWLTTRGDSDAPEKQVAPPHPPGEKRLLVIANETVGGSELLAELKRHAQGRKTEVLVVTPALNSPLKHWVSDEDGAREAAGERLDASLRGDARGRDDGPRRGGRLRSRSGDRRRDPHVRPGRDRHLDTPGGPFQLARARRRRERERALRRARDARRRRPDGGRA